MLQAINDRIKGWLGIVVVALIGLPFALWGIQSYLDDTGPGYAARVNGVEISPRELEFFVSARRQQLAREFKGELPISEATLRKQVFEQLVNQRLLETVTHDNGFRISDDLLALTIKQQFSVDGRFDRNKMDSFLLQIGRTPQAYEYELRNELQVKQLQASLISSTLVTEREVDYLAALDEQRRQVSILTFSVDRYTGDFQATEEAIRDYYEKHSARYMLPERVKVDYVELTLDDIARDIEVDESQIEEKYKAYLAEVANREERKARHILLKAGKDAAADDKVRKTLESIRGKLQSGASFAELARQYSEDGGSAADGGDLGWVATGDMVKPFEDALFGLEKGQLSDIVKTQFGYHLIQLEDIRSEQAEPLGVKRYALEETIKRELARDRFYDLSESMANKAYEQPDSLDEVVEALALPLKTSDYFTREDGDGIAAGEKVRNTAFSAEVLEQGLNSEVIELSPEHIVVLRLNEHIDQQPRPLAEVRDSIVKTLKAQSGYRQTLDAAKKAGEAIAQGAAVDTLVGEGVTLDQPEALSRKDFFKVKDPGMINTIFDMDKPQAGKPSIKEMKMATGDVALLVLHKVIEAENPDESKKAAIKQDRRRQIAIDEFAALLEAIRHNADIEVNERILQ